MRIIPWLATTAPPPLRMLHPPPAPPPCIAFRLPLFFVCVRVKADNAQHSPPSQAHSPIRVHRTCPNPTLPRPTASSVPSQGKASAPHRTTASAANHDFAPPLTNSHRSHETAFSGKRAPLFPPTHICSFNRLVRKVINLAATRTRAKPRETNGISLTDPKKAGAAVSLSTHLINTHESAAAYGVPPHARTTLADTRAKREPRGTHTHTHTRARGTRAKSYP